MLGKWFWSADSQFSVFTDTAAWYGRWDQVKIEQKFGDVNYLLFPVIDDIALIAVLGEGITQKTNIDYVCSTTTSGVYAASSQNYVIYAPETLAHNIVDPKVEHLLFRADDTKLYYLLSRQNYALGNLHKKMNKDVTFLILDGIAHFQ